VWRTRVGYAGGQAPDPTYTRIGDHTECFEVDFDPAVVSYDDLLELFWTSHDPTRQAFKQQYASLLLTRGDEQSETARESAARIGALLGRTPVTRIEPFTRFYLAEDYHQKYYLRNDRVLMREFRAFYPDDSDFVRSTASARANGFVSGAGSCLSLEEELPKLGLSDEAFDHLRKLCRRVD